ncbi:hypothetical protein L4D76_19720 [Photobacterium sagamiensis]|uniref:hypothetical protein n=1 Tax=Photobacterium sagamiensis TaxID=2910241 RepID=UPI003D121ADA
MDYSKDYDFLVMKGAKFQVMINAAINGLVPALTMSGMIGIFTAGGMVQDFLIMNVFLIFFVFIFSRLEVIKWRQKNNAEPVAFDPVKHKGLEKAMHRHPMAEFFVIFVKYNLLMAAPAIAVCLFIFGDAGIPVHQFVFIKATYSVFLANAVAMHGGKLGSIHIESEAKTAKA